MKKRTVKIIFITLITGIVFWLGTNLYIRYTSSSFMEKSLNNLPPKYTCIVLGAHVGNDGVPSSILADRLNAALELYRNEKVKRFLLTGDHGRKNYDEVNNMKAYLEEKGVPQADIFLDHAGFDTYNSMVRAKEVFEVTDVIIVTQ